MAYIQAPGGDGIMYVPDEETAQSSFPTNTATPENQTFQQSSTGPASWQAGYDTLLKQMGAIQGRADVYKNASPLSADTHMQNIAKSLAKDYGINSIGDIGATPGVIPKFATALIQTQRGKAPIGAKTYDVGSDGILRWNDKVPITLQQYHVPGEPVDPSLINYTYYNKNTGQEIPGYKFASENEGDGYSEYNLQAVPDGKGGIIALPIQQYSKSGLGEVAQDLAPVIPLVNAALLFAGVPPLTLAAGNVAFQGAAGNIHNIGDVLKTAAPVLAGDPGILGGAAKVYMAYNAFDKGQVLSGLASLAGAAGMNGLANDIQFVNAIKTGNVPGALMSLGNMSGLFDTPLKDEAGNILKDADGVVQKVGNIKIGGEDNYITLREAVKGSAIAANLLSDKPNYGLAIQMAGDLAGSKDTIIAGKATSLIEALNSGDPRAINNAVLSLAGPFNNKAPGSVPIENRTANDAVRVASVDTGDAGANAILSASNTVGQNLTGTDRLTELAAADLGTKSDATVTDNSVRSRLTPAQLQQLEDFGVYFDENGDSYDEFGDRKIIRLSASGVSDRGSGSTLVDNFANDNDVLVSDLGVGNTNNQLTPDQIALLTTGNNNDVLISDLGAGTTTPITDGTTTTGNTDTKATTPSYTGPDTGQSVTIDGKIYQLTNDGGAFVQNEDGGTTRLNATQFAALTTPATTPTTTPITGGTKTTLTGTTPSYTGPATGESVIIDGKVYSLAADGGAFVQNEYGGVTKLNATQFAALGEPDTANTLNTVGGTKLILTGDQIGALTTNQVAAIDTKNSNTLNTVTVTDKLDPNLGYDWAKDTTTKSPTTITTSQITTITSDQIGAIDTKNSNTLDTVTVTGKLDPNLGYDWAKDTTTKSPTTITTSNIATLPTDKVTTLPTDKVTTLPTDKVTTLPSSQISSQITTLSSNQIATGTSGSTALTSDQISALTTTPALGLRALPTSDARYWRQTGAQGTGGKGGVRFFDWYDTPENRTMAPPAMTTATFGALTSQQAGTIAPPVAKRYFNAATNQYYTDPTGTWQPPAGWAQTGLKGGGEVKTKHFDGEDGSYVGWDDSFSPVDPGIFDYDTGAFDNPGTALGDFNYEEDTLTPAQREDLNNARWESGYFGTEEDIAKNYGNEGRAYSGENAIDPVTGSPINAKVGVPNKRLNSNPFRTLADAARNNPDITKLLLGAGLGGLLGYMGRPKGIKGRGIQGGGLGLSQSQVHGALKGVPVQRAEGGEIGGYAGGGGLHYLKSAEDGMADKIPATIDNKQPAKLSGGEFVIPADVVSHLGNGNSEAGAKQLYAMMDRIRHARTGTKQQGKQINPAKFTPK